MSITTDPQPLRSSNRDDASTPAPADLLGELDRLSLRMRIAAGGLIFFILVGILMGIRRALVGAGPLVITDSFFPRVLRLVILAVVVTPLIHWGLRRISATLLPIQTRLGYGRMLL